jgi:hypothetical protein
MRLKAYQFTVHGTRGNRVPARLDSDAALLHRALKREIEWRLVAFNTQQSAQIQLRTGE